MQNWLVEKGYKERWLLPLKGLNKGTVYENHPIGNSPEMMPLDTLLFKDLYVGVCRHAAQTVLLPFGDPKNSSLKKLLGLRCNYGITGFLLMKAVHAAQK
jgi:hypothetical protein